jgi:hypothetical protein
MKTETKLEKTEDENKKLKRDLIRLKLKESGHKFKNEFKKSTSTAMITAFSLIIALAWNSVITEYVSKIGELSPLSGKLISALAVTIICVLGILIVTKILSVKTAE